MTKDQELYWAYNMPLQAYEDEETRELSVLNYQPRGSRCDTLTFDEVSAGMSRAEFFEAGALHLENLARLMREFGSGARSMVYYHDEDMSEVRP